MMMYIIPSMIMFCCGVYGFITRKNMIAILISLELMLNSVDINFVVFNRFLFPGQLEGMMFTLFCHRYCSCRNSSCHCNYSQHFPRCPKY